MKRINILHGIAFIITLIIFLKFSIFAAIIFIIVYLTIINYPIILFYIGNHKLASDKIDEANKYFERACMCFYSPLKIKMSCCYFLLIQGELDKAEQIVESCLDKKLTDDDKLNLEINHSLITWKRNDLDKAIDILMNLYNNYKTTIIYLNLGYFLILKGDYDKALKFNLEAYEYNTSDGGILDNLAQNYYCMGNHDRAIELYEKLMENTPSFPTAYYHYALALIKKNRFEEALNNLNKALDCKFTFLSVIKKEDIEEKISEVRSITNLVI
jgi:tetratricopeptide (TPR) repeat protein